MGIVKNVAVKKVVVKMVVMLAAAASVIGIGIERGSLKAAAQSEKEPERFQRVSVLFTHDLHSHINSYDTVYQGEDVNIGGFARIQTLIQKQREKDPETLLVDGGDFSMGTLFQTVFETQATELRLLGAMGYDAATLGNHEFDYRSEGLNRMLVTAAKSGEALPELLVCNVDWGECNEEQAGIKEAFEQYGVKDYCVVEKNGVRIALIGVFGKDALECAPTCALTFEDPVAAVAEAVEEIRAKEAVDMLVCLSHGGTSAKARKSEDEILAKKVPELDLIVSAHTHTFLEEPMVHGDTWIVSAGEYGKVLGSFSMTRKDNGRWLVQDYELIPVTEEIESEKELQERIDGFEASIDTDYLSQFGYTADQVLAHNAYSFSTVADLEGVHTEHTLGSFIADAYVYAAENAEGYDGVPVDLAVVPSGTVRDTYVPGDITVEQAFNSFSLGIGEDGIPGYPLISVYLTGEELRTVVEIDASISDFMNTARLYFSGAQMAYNPNRLILNKTTQFYLTDHRLGKNSTTKHMDAAKKDGQTALEEAAETEKIEIEDDKLYRVVADLYSGQMLSSVTDKSFGLLSIVPKHADGTPVTDFADCIISDGDGELKAWVAIAQYMASFAPNAEGVPEIPEYYSAVRGRKVVEEQTDIVSLVKRPNRYAWMILLIGAVILVLVIVSVRMVYRVTRRMLAVLKNKILHA